MSGCSHNFSEKLALHSLPAHEIYIFATTIVVDVIEAMRVSKASFVHFKYFSFVVHVVDKFKVIETYTLVILGKVNTSNFYLNKSMFTLNKRFIAYFIEI